MKQKVLFMTVGTGYGEKGYEDLANGLCTSIKYNSPFKIIFFITEKSERTVEKIKEVYEKDCNDELDSYDCVMIDNPDDFNNCYSVMSKQIEKYEDNNIVVDYTSGTKTMSVSLAVIGILNHFPLMMITGKRGNMGVIQTSTEENKSQNPYQVYDKMNFESFKKHFNNCRFDSAEASLSKIVSLFNDEEIGLLSDVLKMYNDWDKFHHNIQKIDTKSSLFDSMSKQLGLNIKSLSIITKEGHDLRQFYILADMLNNAKRRFNDGRYDDATARLYRSLELIEQIILSEEYGLETSKIKIDDLRKYDLDENYLMELKSKEKDSVIKLGLSDSYYLLYKLGNEIGKYYIDNQKYYLNILSVRNESILAHGSKPVTKEEYMEFEGLVYNIAKLLTPKLDDYLNETEFAKFL